MFELMKEIYRSEVPQFVREFISRLANRIRRSGKFAGGLVFVISVWLVWAAFGRSIIGSGSTYDSYENVGQFGDSFGSLNTLFAGIAAVGATLAYFKQSEQLRNDKAAAEKQQFENTFFQLLNVFHEILNSTRHDTSDETGGSDGEGPEIRKIHGQGREAFQLLAREFESPLFRCWLETSGKIKGGGKNATIQDRFDFLKERYQHFFTQHSPQLSHYFRTLYRLLSIIRDSSVSNKRSYGKIVRAQRSDHELMFLFYNGISWMGEKMNQFVYEFALLKHLPRGSGFPSDETRKFYGDANSPAYNDTPDGTDVKVPGKPYDPAALTPLYLQS